MKLVMTIITRVTSHHITSHQIKSYQIKLQLHLDIIKKKKLSTQTSTIDLHCLLFEMQD